RATALEHGADVAHVLVVAELEVAGLERSGALHQGVETPDDGVADDALAVQKAADRRRRRPLRDRHSDGAAVGMAVDLAIHPEPGEGQQDHHGAGGRQEHQAGAAAAPPGQGFRQLLVLEGVADVGLVGVGRDRTEGTGGWGHEEDRSSQAWSITAAATLSTTRRRAWPGRPSEENDRTAVTGVRRSP